ncbi:MAG: P-II family nitrogen regulator [ANME-2 cluster archaeon]|jgi:nitrogen regulatory protein PII 2|nr:MAG: P-II family nitrogen regulator [ANME-2 cluster archaeon]
MKEVIAIIRMNKIQATKDVLAEAGYTCLTATLVYGRGKQKGLYISPLGNVKPDSKKAAIRFIPKRMLNIVVDDESVPEVVETIMRTNRTGIVGDGRIFVCPIAEAVRIRTGERGDDAL